MIHKQVYTFSPCMHTDMSGREVDEDPRNEKRRDAAGFLYQHVCHVPERERLNTFCVINAAVSIISCKLPMPAPMATPARSLAASSAGDHPAS